MISTRLGLDSVLSQNPVPVPPSTRSQKPECRNRGRCKQASCWQQALLVLSEMSQRGLQLTTAASLQILHLGFRSLPGSGELCCHSTCKVVISSRPKAFDAGCWDMLTPKRTKVTYNATIDACGRAKRWQAAVALFAALRCGSVQAPAVRVNWSSATQHLSRRLQFGDLSPTPKSSYQKPKLWLLRDSTRQVGQALFAASSLLIEHHCQGNIGC